MLTLWIQVPAKVTGEDDGVLRHNAHEAPAHVLRVEASQAMAAYGHAAGVGHELQHREEERALARACPAHDGRCFARGEVQGDAGERRREALAVADLHAIQAQALGCRRQRGRAERLLLHLSILHEPLNGHKLHLQVRVVHDELLDDGHDVVAVVDGEAHQRGTLAVHQAGVLQEGLQGVVEAEAVADEAHAQLHPRLHASLCEAVALVPLQSLQAGAEELLRGVVGADGHLAQDGLDHLLIDRAHADEVYALDLPHGPAVVARVELQHNDDNREQYQREWIRNGQHDRMADKVKHSPKDHAQDVGDGGVHDLHILGEAIQDAARGVGVPPTEWPRKRAAECFVEDLACSADAAKDLQGVAGKVAEGEAHHKNRIDKEELSRVARRSVRELR
mmetsp:Transcript_116531/g.340977  ORF Transcript_116531/g.340977 Transcript_116531/m.340977 type:complete len:392 (+) Transcript_116531:129-1304(+)